MNELKKKPQPKVYHTRYRQAFAQLAVESAGQDWWG